jgi:hypothetical protein
MLDFFASGSWSEMVSEAAWATQCWKGTGYLLTFSVPMLPSDHVATLARGARGDYDAYFRSIGEAIVAAGFRTAVIRIGWEFNGGWYPWAAKPAPDDFVAFWRRIVVAMRAVPGQSFRFDWCPSWGMQQIAPDRVYPGDDVVDIIGLDIYNASWTPATADPVARWRSFVDEPFGLRWQSDFARAHHKAVSFPEWGTGTRPDGHGPGDDPYFVTRMAAWIAAQHALYQDYWNYDAPDYQSRLDNGRLPLSARAYLDSFRHRDAPP